MPHCSPLLLAAFLLPVLCASAAELSAPELEGDTPVDWNEWPAGIKKVLLARFRGSKVISIRRQENHSPIKEQIVWNYRSERFFQVTLADPNNGKFTADFNTEGELLAVGSHKLRFTDLPPGVSDSLSRWAPSAEWDEWAAAQRNRNEQFCYKAAGKLYGKTIRAEVWELGSFKRKDPLPHPPAQKKQPARPEKKAAREEPGQPQPSGTNGEAAESVNLDEPLPAAQSQNNTPAETADPPPPGVPPLEETRERPD